MYAEPLISTEIAAAYAGTHSELEVERRDAVAGRRIEQLGEMLRDVISGTSTRGKLSPAEQIDSLSGWVFTAVSRIRDAVAETPLRVLEAASNDGDDPTEITKIDDDLVALLEHPNGWQTAFEFWQQTMTFLELTGNAVWLKVSDSFGTRELWCLPSQRLKPIVRETGVGRPGESPLVGYSLRNSLGQEVAIPAEATIHLMYSNPKNLFWGLGTLENAAVAIRATNEMKASQLAAFSNQLLTNIAFTTDAVLMDATFDRMMDMLLSRFGGPRNTNKPLLLEAGTKVQQLSRPPAEMDYSGSLEMTREEILAIFGVPPIIAGIVKDANRSNSDTQELSFLKHTIRPRLCLIQSKLNTTLVPEFGDRRWVEFANPVPEDEKAATAKNALYVRSGVIEPNAVRLQLGLPEAPWGEFPQWVYEFKARHGFLPWEEPPPKQPVPTQFIGAPEVDGTEVDEPADDEERRLPARPQFRTYVRSLTAAQEEFIDRVAGDYERLERSTLKALQPYFRRQAERIEANVLRLLGAASSAEQRAAVVSHRADVWMVQPINARLYIDGTLRQYRHRNGFGFVGHAVHSDICCHGQAIERERLLVRDISPDFMGLFDDWDRAADELVALMRKKLEAALVAGGTQQISAMAISGGRFDINNPRAESWLREKDRSYWDATVSRTTQQQLGERLAEVLNDKPTPEKLADAVREVMQGRIRSSANTIARTEVTEAYNAAGWMVREEHRISESEWMATIDGRTRTSPQGGHLAADGQVRRHGVPFDVGGERLDYPGDAKASVWNRANCRCTAAAIPSEDDEIAPGFDDAGGIVGSADPSSSGPGPAPVASATIPPTFGRSMAPVRLAESLSSRELTATIHGLFGEDTAVRKRHLASLAGAIDDAEVVASLAESPDGETAIRLLIEGPEHTAARRIFKDGAGKVVILNEGLEVDSLGGNIAARMLGRQVEQSAAMGVHRIEVVGKRSGSHNGYRVWPRLGFDADIPARLLEKLPEGNDALRLSQLMATPEGREFWDEHGVTLSLSFDLSRRSHARQILARFLARKAEAGVL